jgi:autotransporter-associated beta strand protein
MKTPRLALLSTVLAATSALGANYSWDGGGTPVEGQYLWTDGNNWLGDAAPPEDSTIYFRTAAGAEVLLSSPASVTALWFQPLVDLSGVAGSFTLSGGALTFTNVLGIQNQSGSAQIINNDLIFTASGESAIRGFRYSNTAPLNGPGNVTINGNVTANNGLFLRADNNSVVTVNGNIAGTAGAAVSVRTGGDSSGSIYLNGVNNISVLNVAAGRAYLGNGAAVNVGVELNLTSDGSFFYLNGHNLEISSLTNSGANNGRQRVYNGSATAVTLTYNRSTTDETFTGQLSENETSNNNNYAFVKKGSNTLTLAPLSNGNRYNGGTTVEAGTLLIYNPGSSVTATGSGVVTVWEGAAFGGDGYASGAVVVDGTLRVGMGESAAGTLTLGGALTLNSDSVIELSLGADGAHSVLARTGSGAWTFDADQQFTLRDFGIEAGTYAGVITGLSSAVDTAGWTITNAGWAATFAYNAGNIDLTISAIPEPSTALSLLAAAGILAWKGSRCRKRSA